ncbi:YtcA family lipoprotein [Tropicimonas sp. IMCC34043]|uniref:YtcA family lipoprotein n=1 Tax=Tropicimonas sp. IMCC34043 TaxID=2248760 RepID=UPI0018E5443E|nr:YtcA family lipoprotein [Tropicimonas sp. IMCC34043]
MRKTGAIWSTRHLAVAAAAIVSGLTATPAISAAPSIGMFGSFFPSWLICLFAGVIATVILRVLFVVIRLDDILQWRVPVYMSMALGLTFLFSYLFFGR